MQRQSPSNSSMADSKSCDTLPAPQNLLAKSSLFTSLPPSDLERSLSEPFDAPFDDGSVEDRMLSLNVEGSPDATPSIVQSSPPARKLCVRHQRMADEGISFKLQQSLDALPLSERETINNLWSTFSSSDHSRRAVILQGILTMCCFSQLSLISTQLDQLIRIDPFFVLPREVSLKVLKYLDAVSLTRAAQVSRSWRSLADDDILWRNMCEQHIEKKCAKCGWGLPLLERKTLRRAAASSSDDPKGKKRQADFEAEGYTHEDPIPAEDDGRRTPDSVKKRRLNAARPSNALSHFPSFSTNSLSSLPSQSSNTSSYPSDNESEVSLSPMNTHVDLPTTRPWKDVYSERLTIERNWRRGRYQVTTIKGHTDGVMCLQFDENLDHPSFPVLITGSYDRTARVWNMETGQEVRCLKGHTRAVRALQFDKVKLVTGSMDRTLKVWDWRTGRCIRTLHGHTEGVVCLKFDSNVLASGSVDATVKVWNFRTGESFTLRGHRDWVNAVTLWDGRNVAPSHHDVVETGGVLPDLDVGKMLFSASDDGSIRLWDLAERTCVKQYTGHVGQVQTLQMVFVDGDADAEERREKELKRRGTSPGGSAPLGWEHTAGMGVDGPIAAASPPSATTTATSLVPTAPRGPHPVLISGSLDNTIKAWDIETGENSNTLFGHIEGVWAVASDKLRLVSGSHDRTIKLWEREQGRCSATLVGHRGAVTCLALGDDKIVSGSDDGDVKIWSFAPVVAA